MTMPNSRLEAGPSFIRKGILLLRMLIWKKRAEVLSSIVDRYRSTPAEAKSLMMAARIAPKATSV